MTLHPWRAWRERGWQLIDATTYRQVWQRFGGSVATHPDVIERLAGLAQIPVRYLGWEQNGGLVAAVPCWGRHLALSKEVLKKRGKRGLFDLGNAEIILPLAEEARVPVRQRLRYVSELNAGRIVTLRKQPEGLALARQPEDYSKKFRYNLRREQRLFEEAGGEVRPLAELTPVELAAIYTDLFERRWGFEVPGKSHLAEVFGLLQDFLRGSLLMLDGFPVAVQVLYRVESLDWISYEYINGGVDPRTHHFSPGSVLSFINTQAAWADARSLGKPLRYSFGRADCEYKDRWCHRVPVYQS
ncbi:GNAT family N-acetyltransferase [Stutzerimonas stutzeri]|uniref:GNAT family N-acetyltransferase n=1 Tax=Pseudomonadaceae TaxID=135621 RepID=UPI00042DEBD2|nr:MULTISPECIES: GNAT family N-acetyltransferase [Pseudomonadaceae]EXF45345.1 Mig-14 family protein [Pseudomonas sp. BAY1663]MDH0726195.1 antimicrobial resistance protein Mig-14 [Stutzerimonas stutzeri]RRV73102.1 GNAT family N-acetyltransferase [Stutzerimonas stutzeri]